MRRRGAASGQRQAGGAASGWAARGLNDEQEEEEDSSSNFTGRLWEGIDLNTVRRDRISEWVRLAKLVLTIPIGSVANERRFSPMNLVITALRNRMQAPHANVCMRIASSHFTYVTFPLRWAYAIWSVPGQEREQGLF